MNEREEPLVPASCPFVEMPQGITPKAKHVAVRVREFGSFGVRLSSLSMNEREEALVPASCSFVEMPQEAVGIFCEAYQIGGNPQKSVFNPCQNCSGYDESID